ncbi:MAG: ubiquinol oxidase, partial [Polaromonas sp.]
ALGFAVIWHMWLIAGLAFIATLAFVIFHTFNYKRDFYIAASEVEHIEGKRTALLMA